MLHEFSFPPSASVVSEIDPVIGEDLFENVGSAFTHHRLQQVSFDLLDLLDFLR
jgi:hypothetical protein